MNSEKNNQANKYILIFFLLLFSVMTVYALSLDSHYKFDIPICMILLTLVYIFRQYLFLISFHYFLYSIFLFIHCLGMFDFYNLYIFKIEYDYWVHAYFGFVSILMILHLLKKNEFSESSYIINLMAIIIILGLSSIHELYEFAGALILGEGEGVLFIGAGDLDQWDTQKDMLNNLIGGIFGVLFSLLYSAKR